MKRLFVSLLFCVAGITCSAQTLTFDSPNEESQRILDSVKFVLPEFASGIVIFNDGTQSNGALNINTMTQCVHFIDPDGKDLALVNNNQVSKVFIKNRLFLNSRYGYIEVYETTDDVFMGELRSVNFISEAKEGAFGSKSQTTSIQTLTHIETSAGYRVDFEKQKNSPYSYKKIPYLHRKGAFVPATKKAFQRYFPSKKEFIEQYVDKHDLRLNHVDHARELFKTVSK